MERQPIKGCDKADCPINKCLCFCHEGMMDHMFACCVELKCDCGKVVHRTVVDGGVYYKENQ
jgi:hypothetical protein